MNNIQKKNKIYGLSYKADLPSKSVSDVTVKANQIIYTSINNNLEKLIDNDLFIEKQLQNAQQYQIGPKKYSSFDIDSKENGYKMWNRDINKNVELSILRKSDDELQEMLQQTNISTDTNFIVDIGSERLVGTVNGLYRLNSDTQWTTEKSGILNNKNVLSYSVDLNNSIYIFTTDDGIYQTTKIYTDQDIEFDKKSEYSNVRKIFLLDNIIYIYYNGFVYSADNISNSETFDFKQYKTSSNTYLTEELISVNKLNDDLFITTNKGVYGNIKEYSFTEINDITFDSNILIKFFIKFNGDLYLATNKGLYNTDKTRISTISSEIYNYCIYKNRLFLLIGRTLYEKVDDSLQSLCVFDTTFANQSIGIIDDNFIITNNKKIYWVKIDAENLNNLDNWNIINLNNESNPSQLLVGKKLLISGKSGTSFNITEINTTRQENDTIVVNNAFGLNKIVYYNDNTYYLTKDGLYLNNLNTKKLNGDITDISFENDNWCATINGRLYWNSSNDFSIQHSTSSQTFTNCRILNSCIYAIQNGKVCYQLDVNFSDTSLNLTTIDSEINITHLEIFNNEIYVLGDNTLYKLYPKYILNTEIHDISNDSFDDDILRGFSYTCTDNKGIYQSIYGIISNNIYSYQYDRDLSDYTLVKKGQLDNTDNIKSINEYYYFRDTDEFLYDIQEQKDLNGTLTGYSIISCAEQFAEDIIQIYQNNTLYVYNSLSNGELSNISQIEINNVVNTFQVFDLYDEEKFDSNFGSELSSNITLIFGNNFVKYAQFQFDRNEFELWENETIENYNGSGVDANVSVGCYDTVNFVIHDIPSITKLQNLKCVTNVDSLVDKNIFFFVTNNKNIYYYNQNTNKNLITDFINDNIKTINVDSITESINQIAAVEDSGIINIFVKTNSFIFTTSVSVDNINGTTIKWNKNSIDNTNFDFGTFQGEIIGTTDIPMSYNTFVGSYDTEIKETGEHNLLNIKTDTATNQFYKIRDNQISLINRDNSIEYNSISNIKNISYVNGEYNFIGETGLSVSNEFENVPTQVKLLNNISLVDVGDNIYGTNEKIYKKTKQYYDVPYILKTVTTTENHLNLKIDDNSNITFNNDEQVLKILNYDYNSVDKIFITNEKQTVILSRETDNLVITTKGKIFDKQSHREVVSNNINNLFNGVPIVTDEKNNYIITYPQINILKEYTDIGINNYFSKKIEFDNINNVFNFDNDKLMLVDSSKLYYYFPETNVYFNKYNGNDNITNIEKDIGQFIISEGNNIYSISKSFGLNSKEFLLSCENLLQFNRKTKFDYLLRTDDEVFQTIYSYTIENDIPLCSIIDIKDYTRSSFDNGLATHIKDLHNEYSTVTHINDKLMPVDCSNLKGITNNTEIGDFIETVEFSDGAQYISAYVNFDNELSVNNISLSGIHFITKNYSKTNICEMFIYIPTTNTNYINHNDEIKNDPGVSQVVHRKNVDVSTNCSVNDNKTNITLKIDKYHFDINRIVAVDINGNSLPLKIYIDNDNQNLFSFNGFSQVIKKSMYKQLAYDERNDYITMEFMCFGTDAQAIRLETIKNTRYIIRYHKHDGIYEESYVVDIIYDVPYNEQIINGKEFKGWSRADNLNIAELKYKTTFKNIGKKDEVIDMYPVYEDYVFDASDSTIFTLKPNTNAIYFDGGIVENELVQVDYDAVIESTITVQSNKTPVIISKVEINDDKQIIVDWDYNKLD